MNEGRRDARTFMNERRTRTRRGAERDEINADYKERNSEGLKKLIVREHSVEEMEHGNERVK